MKTHLLILFLCLLLTFALPAAAEQGSVRIMLASDLHYLAPELYQDSQIFTQLISAADGKAAMYSKELLAALLDEARHQQPDVLVLSGDLTFNGERLSHQELADAMRSLATEGIPVVVIPGNHDINSPSPVRYLPYSYEPTDNVDSQAFGEIWSGLTAEEMTGPGFCGLFRVTNDVWLAMGDYSLYENGAVSSFGLATAGHLQWVNEAANAAAKAGATMISVSHQALVPHTSFASDAYRVWYGEQAVGALVGAGCRLNLSGHMHMQHITTLGRMTDIATGAWSMTPHHYAIITVTPDGAISYGAETVCQKHLPEGVLEASRAFFRSVSAAKMGRSLQELSLSAEDAESMVNYSVDLHEAYFAGTIAHHPELIDHPARELWMTAGGSSSFGSYIEMMLSDCTQEMCSWSSKQD